MTVKSTALIMPSVLNSDLRTVKNAQSRVLRLSRDNVDFDDDFTNFGPYPSQSGSGTTSAGNYTAKCEQSAGSIVHTGSARYVLTHERRSGETVSLTRPITSINLNGANVLVTFKVKVTTFPAVADLIHIGFFDSANTNRIDDSYVAFRISSSGRPAIVSRNDAAAAEVAGTNGTAGDVVAGTQYFCMLIIGNGHAGFVLATDDRFTEIVAADEQVLTGAFTCDLVGTSNRDIDTSLGVMVWELDDFLVQLNALVTTKPVNSYQEIDSGINDAVWDMSSTSGLTDINMEYRVKANNSSGGGTFTAFLSLTTIKALTDLVGKFFNMEGRTTLTDGSTSVFYQEGTIDVIVTAAVPPTPSITAVS